MLENIFSSCICHISFISEFACLWLFARKKSLFPSNLRSFLLFCTFSFLASQSFSQFAYPHRLYVCFGCCWHSCWWGVCNISSFLLFSLCQKDFRADQNIQFVQYFNVGWVREKVKLRYLYIEIFRESQVLTHKVGNCYCCLSHTANFVFRA